MSVRVCVCGDVCAMYVLIINKPNDSWQKGEEKKKSERKY